MIKRIVNFFKKECNHKIYWLDNWYQNSWIEDWYHEKCKIKVFRNNLI